MDHKQYQEWLSGIDRLSPAQRREAEAVLSGGSQASASLAAIEAAVGEDRRCPHCGTPGAVSRGKARGLRRYQCKGCGKTFNAATGTPLSGLHRKERWLPFGNCLSEGMTVRASAGHCKLAVNTSFRWRHRFLAAKQLGSRKLTGIVEADETFVLESRKGERQRIAIARAIILRPRFILLDEPTSALDLSIQAQIIDLLRELRRRHDLSYLFISHDLKVVKALCHNIIVMQHGNVVEQGPTGKVLQNPETEYTRRLVDAALNPDMT